MTETSSHPTSTLAGGRPRSTGASVTRFLDRGEGRIAWDDAGEGPLVVLVPGLGDVRAEYRHVVPLLTAAGRRVVSLDLRGHGESDVRWSDYSAVALGEDVVALLTRLDAGPAVLIGTSMGAAAVAWVAANAPEKVEALVLIGPFVRDVPPGSRLAGWLRSAVIAFAASGPWGPWMWGKYLRSIHRRPPADLEAHVGRVRANLSEPGRMTALAAMMRTSKAAVEARLDRIRAPTLVVMGTADPDFVDPTAEAETVARRTGGRVAAMEGLGHYPQAEDPATFMDVLAPFLRSPRDHASRTDPSPRD